MAYEESYLDLPMGEVWEPTLLKEGEEVTLRIKTARIEDRKDRNKNTVGKNLHVVFEEVTNPRNKDIKMWFAIPNVREYEEDPKGANERLARIATLWKCFGVDYQSGPVNLQEAIGRTGEVIVGLSNSDDFGENNFIRKFNVPA